MIKPHRRSFLRSTYFLRYRATNLILILNKNHCLVFTSFFCHLQWSIIWATSSFNLLSAGSISKIGCYFVGVVRSSGNWIELSLIKKLKLLWYKVEIQVKLISLFLFKESLTSMFSLQCIYKITEFVLCQLWGIENSKLLKLSHWIFGRLSPQW